MKKPDFNTYTIRELKEALSGLDQNLYPERFDELQQLLAQRRLQVPDEEELPCIYAGFLPRFLAQTIDSLFIMLLFNVAYFFATGVLYDQKEISQSILASSTVSLLVLIYFTLNLAINGQTPGKAVLRMKVVQEKTGGPPGVVRSLIRYLGYFVSSIPLLLGYLWAIWHPKKKAWHDMIAGTVVVWVHLYDQDEAGQ